MTQQWIQLLKTRTLAESFSLLKTCAELTSVTLVQKFAQFTSNMGCRLSKTLPRVSKKAKVRGKRNACEFCSKSEENLRF